MFMSRLPFRYPARLLRRGLALLLGMVLVLVSGTSTLPTTPPAQTEILWDTYGVPHVYGKDEAGLFYAFGWAQMHSHADALLRLYGQARGQAAEYWGEDYRESDQWVRIMGIPQRAEDWYTQQSPTFQRNLKAFADGINAYAKAHPDWIDDAVEPVLPIQATDILAHAQRVLHFTFVTNPHDIAELRDRFSKGEDLNAFQPDRTHAPGSNAWAIAPSHTTRGHAMLLANPHLPWSDLFRWYEAHLVAPGLDAYGATLVGIPVLAIAFNNELGWTHTVNTHDGWDAYALDLAEGGYRWQNQIRPFVVESQVLRVKQTDGSLREEPLAVRQSVQGPVLAASATQALALRVVGLNRPRALEEWWQMARAHNLKEFEGALRSLQLPMFTVLYADRRGHILHLFNGLIPVREQGDFDDWSAILPGDTPRTLWSQYHPYRDLPRVLDPASGWLQNANDPPWTTTFPSPIKPEHYPAYMAPRGPMSFRAQRSAQMLSQDPKISFSELVQYKHSTRAALADRLLDDLIVATQYHGNPLARRAATVLRRWDRQTNPQSRGAVLFAAWVEAMDFDTLFATPWDSDAPLTTPNGLADPAHAVAVLEQVATQVKATYGRLDIPWGDAFRLTDGQTSQPANGGDEPLGVFRSLWFVPEGDRFTAIGGDSYVAAIEFTNPVRAMALTSYGNATQTQARQEFQSNSLQLFTQQKLRPVWRSRREIQAHLTAQEQF